MAQAAPRTSAGSRCCGRRWKSSPNAAMPTPGSPTSLSASVRARQEVGDCGLVDARVCAMVLSALLDGLAIQIALGDPAVDAGRAVRLSTRFAADQLGFGWRGPDLPPAAAGGSRNRGGGQ